MWKFCLVSSHVSEGDSLFEEQNIASRLLFGIKRIDRTFPVAFTFTIGQMGRVVREGARDGGRGGKEGGSGRCGYANITTKQTCEYLRITSGLP